MDNFNKIYAIKLVNTRKRKFKFFIIFLIKIKDFIISID